MNAKPIATYVERLLEVRREFALYDDRIIVRARWRMRGDFENVVKLATLKGDIEELTIRYRIYRHAGWMTTAGGLVFAMSYYYAGGKALGVEGYLAMGTMILGSALMALTYPNRRIRFARFKSRTGHPGLDIGCAGNDMAVFRDFVAQVRWRIPKA